ncbi:hypothetical protein JAAARDRAFT_196743 [Jaapia argillacea MUCL 33604]|uniref:Uncharacterized protein n=1 Tax=Jaapia argillacea MUCL 33604 TaxID=933084 RepID=A0A067PKL7_9AGAM|nr:hypothetical protein JAAARDRAFT_196743 [Jaapia argillacea MUCL 33604]
MPITLASPLSLYSILGVLLTGFYPIVRRTVLLKSKTGFNNVQPRGNVHRLREKYPDIAAQAERMEGANANGNEILSLWVGAILAANYAGLPNETLNLFSLAFIAMRMLYNYIYMKQTTQAQGDLRGAVWTVGTIIPAVLIVKSGNAVLAAAV